MVNATSTPTPLIQWYQNVDSFLSLWGNTETAIGIIILCLVFIYVLLGGLTKKLSETAKQTLNNLSCSGKYIRDLYVEPQDIGESMRYFLFKTKWKRKIISRYNALFIGAYKEAMQRKGLLVYICPLSPLKKVYKIVSEQLEWFKNHEKEQTNYNAEIDHDLEIFIIHNKEFIEALSTIKCDLELIQTRYCHLIGNAGCGKTNISCKIAENAISNHYPCVLFEARDIHERISEYMLKRLSLCKVLSGHVELMLFLLNLTCRIKRKKFLIIIDAINENDSDQFTSSLEDFVNEMLKYKNFVVLLTCRKEYYSVRKEKLLKNEKMVPFIFSPSFEHAHTIDAQLILSLYKQYFNFTGKMSACVEKKLTENMFLLRMFFESFKDHNDTVLSINRYEIYKQYIDIYSEKIKQLDTILTTIAECMIMKQKFSHLRLNIFSASDQERIEEISANGGILLVKSIIEKPHTILEKEQEDVSFVYDELRDYYIVRSLLQMDKESIQAILRRFMARSSSPLEGVLKYCYEYYKQMGQFIEAKRILNNYCHESIHTGFKRFNLGISVIIESSMGINEYEMDYIIEHLCDYPYSNGFNVFSFIFDENRNPGIIEIYFKKLISSRCEIANRHASIIYQTYHSFDNDFINQDQLIFLATHKDWRNDDFYPMAFLRLFVLIHLMIEKKEYFQSQKAKTLREALKYISNVNPDSLLLKFLVIGDTNGIVNAKEFTNNLLWQEPAGYFVRNENISRDRFYYRHKFYFSKLFCCKSIFLHKFKVPQSSYMGRCLAILYDEYVKYSYYMRWNFFRWYHTEMRSYNEYLKQRHNISANYYCDYRKLSSRCKEFSSSIQHYASELLDHEIIRKTMEEYLEGRI